MHPATKNFFKLLLLGIITAGLYYAYWYWQMHKMSQKEGTAVISKGWVIAGCIALALTIIALGSQMYLLAQHPHLQNNSIYGDMLFELLYPDVASAVQERYDSLESFLSAMQFVNIIIFLTLALKTRKFLQKAKGLNVDMVGTIFFGALYLQFKIDKHNVSSR